MVSAKLLKFELYVKSFLNGIIGYLVFFQ